MEPSRGVALRTAALVLGLALAGCMTRPARPDRAPEPVVAAPPAAPPAAPTSPQGPPAPTSLGEVAPPPDYVRMHASEVVPAHESEAVLLLDDKETVAVPIFIGGSEATSIRLRLGKRRYPRPLTHDLFDQLLREVGGQLLKVQVDDLKDGTFLGSIFIRAGNRVVELDARPSDAIALAIGNRVPIFVSCRVIAAAAIPRASFLDTPNGPESDLQVEGCPAKKLPEPSPAPTQLGI
jgi:bifunctional DNase/RNase